MTLRPLAHLSISALAALSGWLSPSWGAAVAVGGVLAVLNVWIFLRGKGNN